MSSIRILPGKLTGKISAPPSKSAVHRALICAALAGNGIVKNISVSKDIAATLGALKALGFIFKQREGEVEFFGRKEVPGRAVIDCGESGSTLRFMIPVAAALGQQARFIGSGRLPERPISEYKTLLNDKGVTLDSDKLPINIDGRLDSGVFEIPGNISSQYISGMLMALPLAGGGEIRLTSALESAPYVDMTLQMMRRFGVRCEARGQSFIVEGGQYKGAIAAIEGDYSQAAFWLAAGAISGDVTVENLSSSSLQGDRRIVELLRGFGANVSQSREAVTAKQSALTGMDIDARDIPDLVPVLAVLGAYASGKTRIYNIERLQLKESDRKAAVYNMIKSMGGEIELAPESIIIKGSGLSGGEIDTENDHRIAMAGAIAALGAKNGAIIKDYRCVDKSYPDFYRDFIRLGGVIDGLDLGE
ncbi:MAG TPA: 3-phosphoshikimate 1-carboxyvinyltransferase [Clostridia bacterium]|nr:3-phosphoshikimate 1-carboxyvinyltransferase [Clostridia bacterium]